MTQNDIDSYLLASRAYIDNSKRRIASMGFCCPAVFLGGLMDRQNQLERVAWNERHRDGSMGIWWLAVGVVGVASSYIAAYVYDHYTKAKMQSDYLDCLNKYQTEYGSTPEEAAKICGQGGEGLKESIANTVKLAIYGGVAIMGLYVVSKYLGKKH